ncbi:MAG: protein-disulfide reductase DsbD domain-containing protein, partial [Limisphaerales bacterium]
MKYIIWLICLCAGVARAAGPSPFVVQATMASSNGAARVLVHFEVPAQHVLYASRLSFGIENGPSLQPVSIPAPITHQDSVTGREQLGYDHPFTVQLALPNPLPDTLWVKFQGCSNSACYFPEKHRFHLGGEAQLAELPPNPPPATEPELASASGSLPGTNGFQVVARETGYLSRSAFLKFLDSSPNGGGGHGDAIARFERIGLAGSLLLIVAGGFCLNFTPCVLPMIPINLALLGAGARSGSRRRGFALGAVYGSGMALVYGALGLLVVLTGAKFGTLNSSAWFN